jgi:hypothetical protein
MKLIVAQFMLDEYDDKESTDESDRKPQDVDSRIAFMSFHIAESDFYIVFKHDKSPNNIHPEEFKA